MEKENQYQISDEIIDGYHRVIEERYQFDKIREKYELPPSITEERFNALRDYFLYQMYPSVERRKDLNEAFSSLDDHLRNPDHLARIMIDSASLIFKYGRHLPSILKAGFRALQSFRTVNKLEGKLVNIAKRSDSEPPYSPDQIKRMMTQLPRQEVDQFIEDGLVLFDTIYDRELIRKILEVILFLINKMKKRPKVYSGAEVRGLEYGLQVLEEGDRLFTTLNPMEQKVLIDFIYKVEKDAVEEIFTLQNEK